MAASKPEKKRPVTEPPIESTHTSPPDKKVEAEKVVIEIQKLDSLIKILSDNKKTGRAIGIIFATFIIFFGCLYATILGIKTKFPYSYIQTNIAGATTTKVEDKEITYWLFNASELWASTGIKVHKGDRLSIHSSGGYHTAVHHLYHAVDSNEKQNVSWIGPEGVPDQLKNNKDIRRDRFRLYPNAPTGALIMQVIPETYFSDNKLYGYSKLDFNKMQEDGNLRAENSRYLNQFYHIGKSRSDIIVQQNGILTFAVNDVVITNKVAEEMIAEYKKDPGFLGVARGPKDGDMEEKYKLQKEDTTEMHYYKRIQYWDAWYDDNIGSLLIVIEKKTN